MLPAVFAAVFLLAGLRPASAAPVDPAALSLDDAVKEVLAASPAVRAARAQYEAASHQLEQAYTPADPEVSLQNSQTPNAFTKAQTRSVGVSEALQFPGKALLQGNEARRAAEIARLAYETARRDAAAQAVTAYYQLLLDSASVRISEQTAASLQEVLQVARIAYTANQNSQTDLISAQFAVLQASQTVLASEVAQANDEAALNQLLRRPPESPLALTTPLELAPYEPPLETVRQRALSARQELLEAALSEKNAQTARTLAWLELLPDFNLSWMRNNYPQGSINSVSPAQPHHDFSTGISFNVPLFFWFRQKQDIEAASRLLEAARESREGVALQTQTSVTQLYRLTQLAYKNALLSRDVLAPLAAQNLKVALIAYQAKKIDFTTLASILQSVFTARIGYLTAANQFLAGRVALEQAMGGPVQ